MRLPFGGYTPDPSGITDPVPPDSPSGVVPLVHGGFKERCAELLADEVDVLVRRKIIDSRSPAADALLDYRSPPSTPRSIELANLRADIERLTKERDEARRFGEEAAEKYNQTLTDPAFERVLRCAFCAAEYPPATPPTQDEALTAHVKVCAKHPMR